MELRVPKFYMRYVETAPKGGVRAMSFELKKPTIVARDVSSTFANFGSVPIT